MKRNRTSLVIALALLAVSGCNVSFSTARITDAKLAKEVNDRKEAINPTAIFEPGDKVIHCVVQLANAPDDTKVRARLIAVRAEGLSQGQKLAETETETKGADNVDFTFTPGAGGFAPGEYRVDVYLNPAADQEGKPDRSLPFTVQGAAATGAVVDKTINGQIKDGREVEHNIQATRGQTITVNLTSDTNDVVFSDILTPGGESLLPDDVDTYWSGQAPETGTYKIIVGAIESEAATYTLQVIIR
ncbi:MAG TPA: hypothetical protein VNO70_10085 [Blastocatellia bacterium]|nr:hypothetical protein [Blastocatellia bacterium]